MRSLARLASMDTAEIGWRTSTLARTAADRVRSKVNAPQWNRRALAQSLCGQGVLGGIAMDIRAGRWSAADRGLREYMLARPARFVIDPSRRGETVARIGRAFPEAPRAARARADRVAAGSYDLLGYRGLRFDPVAGSDLPARAGRFDRGGLSTATALPDWHLDPVHGCRAPRDFWADVPYLDLSCGDHKVIWELNRHQHWLTLGRAFWLTGDERYRRRVLDELESWRVENPPLAGINWASMLELSFRTLSWIWAVHFFAQDSDEERPWLIDLLTGIDRQLLHVERNLSYYFSPNTHLLGEALALYVAGRTFPELTRSGRREALGRRILQSEIGRQIGDDGGHCERSTHYHRYTLDFYLLALIIARITDDPVADTFADAVARLAEAARALADDTGRLPHIGDDDGGALMRMTDRAVDHLGDSLAAAAALLGRPELAVSDPPEETYWLLAHPSLAPRLERSGPRRPWSISSALPDMGYYVSRSAAGDHLVIDGGRHGYKNAGHAHADALSLTFAVQGIPLLIDPGTGCYTADPEVRDRFRSSAMHNTVTVDGRPQSIARGPFHWQSTANARVHEWSSVADVDYFEGSHDGYGAIEHRRHVMFERGRLLIVADLVAGDGEHEVTACWHIDPRWSVESDGDAIVLVNGDRRCALAVTGAVTEFFRADPLTGLGWHAPVYGRLEPATTIRVTRTGRLPIWIVSTFVLQQEAVAPASLLQDAVCVA